MEYLEMDITEPLFIDEDSFNFIIDKGCLDCVACSSENQGEGGEAEPTKIEKMITNIYKTLTPGGTYICISRGAPETRLIYLSNNSLNWTIETLKVQKRAPTLKNTGVQSSDIEAFDRIDTEPYIYVYICDKKY